MFCSLDSLYFPVHLYPLRFRRSILTAIMLPSLFLCVWLHHYERLIFHITRDYLVFQFHACRLYLLSVDIDGGYSVLSTNSTPPSIFTLYAFAGLFLRRLCYLPSTFITLYILTRNETYIYYWLGLSSHYALVFYFLSLYLSYCISLYARIKLNLFILYPITSPSSFLLRWSLRGFTVFVL
jgi:hypothetical protein